MPPTPWRPGVPRERGVSAGAGKNGFRLEETIVEKAIKSGMARDVKLYRNGNFF
jgi:hypothetical protein